MIPLVPAMHLSFFRQHLMPRVEDVLPDLFLQEWYCPSSPDGERNHVREEGVAGRPWMWDVEGVRCCPVCGEALLQR